MTIITRLLLPLFFITVSTASAQQKTLTAKPPRPTVFVQQPRNEKEWLKTHIDSLTQHNMFGRGYVNGGRDSAAKYVLKKIREYKLKPVVADGSYVQGYAFPVNTFPGRMEVWVNDQRLHAGEDYLVDASSPSCDVDNMNVEKVNLGKIKDLAGWQAFTTSIDAAHVYYLEDLKLLCELLHMRKEKLMAMLPRGIYVVPEDTKLTWSVSRETIPATIIYIREAILPKKFKSLTAHIAAQLLPKARSENIVAMVPGDIKDTFIAITSHYDHLGMMGDSVIFSGASDNASGTAVLLSLANYFAKNPQHYSILFIAFAGEEAGLMGSEFFRWHPMVPLKSIKFLTNIDIMSDAKNGISVVNGTEYPNEFAQLTHINDKNAYVTEIRCKGQAANSDHYHFSEAGVPAFFIYSNGGKEHYHDVFDTADQVSLDNVGLVNKMIIDFVKTFQ